MSPPAKKERDKLLTKKELRMAQPPRAKKHTSFSVYLHDHHVALPSLHQVSNLPGKSKIRPTGPHAGDASGVSGCGRPTGPRVFAASGTSGAGTSGGR